MIRSRVKTGIENSGFKYAVSRLVVNMAPADVKKEGPVLERDGQGNTDPMPVLTVR
jgi:predicted ATPase with chaperone activity